MSDTHPEHRILVIDDDEVMREILSMVLSMEGHRVHTAESGDDALSVLAGMAKNELPEVVLTDLQMPGLSGAGLAAELRSANPEAILLAMSGSWPVDAELVAFDGFLLKPFTPEDFEEAVAKGGGGLPQGGTTTGAGIPALNEGIYEKLVATMAPGQLNQLYGMCLDDALARIERMTAAAEAGDAETFTREAHAIKGGCGMLGATEMHGLAAQMETGALACTPLLDTFRLAAERLRRILGARS